MQTCTPGPRCIKLFARLFFCHRKTLANLYANCNGKKKIAGVSWVFAVKNSGKSFMQRGPGGVMGFKHPPFALFFSRLLVGEVGNVQLYMDTLTLCMENWHNFFEEGKMWWVLEQFFSGLALKRPCLKKSCICPWYCISCYFREGFIFANFASQTLVKISTSIHVYL